MKIYFFIIIIFLFFLACDKKDKDEKYSSNETTEQKKNTSERDVVRDKSNNEESGYKTTRDNLEFLKKFDGKYPYEINLFDYTELTQRLKDLLDNRYDFLFETWAVETPIEIKGNIFVAEACQAHNCDATNFIIVYDFSTNILYVGIREEYQVETYSEDGSSSAPLDQWSN